MERLQESEVREVLTELESHDGQGLAGSIAEACGVAPETALAALHRVRARRRVRVAAATTGTALLALGAWMVAASLVSPPVDGPPETLMRPARLAGS